MKALVLSSMATALVLFTVACGNGTGHAGRAKVNSAQKTEVKLTSGLWMRQDQANELRSTGKLDSACEALKADSENAMVIAQTDDSNNLYMRGPVSELSEDTRVGQMTKDGFVLSETQKKESSEQIDVKEANGVLTISSRKANAEQPPVSFVSVNQEEVQKYFAAFEGCKN